MSRENKIVEQINTVSEFLEHYQAQDNHIGAKAAQIMLDDLNADLVFLRESKLLLVSD
jgi:hypothetical protein